MPTFRLIIALTVIAVSCLLAARPALSLEMPLEANESHYDLSNHVEYLIDDSGELTIEQLLHHPDQHTFIPSKESRPAPQNINTPIWVKITLDFPELEENKRFVLTTLIANFNDIRIYRPNPAGEYQEFITGNHYLATQREIASPRYSFLINPSIRQQTIYLRTMGGLNTHHLPWVLQSKPLFDKNSYTFWVINLVSIGALLGIFFFTVGIGVTLKNKNYLFYGAYILMGTLSLSKIDGFGFFILWPNAPDFNKHAIDIFSVGVAATRLLTILSFFDTKKLAPRLYQMAKVWLWLLAACFIVACTTGLKPIFHLLSPIIWLLSLLFGLIISIYAIKKKTTLAIPIFIVLLIPSVGAALQILAELGILPPEVITLQSAKIAFVLHALLFSVCLALQIKHEENNRILAQHDGLTGLPSLSLATDRFSKAAAQARRHQWKLAILFVDLDGFKAVNDTYGHEMGNKLLIEVAKRMTSNLRDMDTIARIGGDEFLIIQTEVKNNDAVTKVAEKVISALSQPFTIDGIDINIGASIGVSEYPDHGDDFNSLVTLADNAMYSIKKSGKNNYCLHPNNSALTSSPLY